MGLAVLASPVPFVLYSVLLPMIGEAPRPLDEVVMVDLLRGELVAPRVPSNDEDIVTGMVEFD